MDFTFEDTRIGKDLIRIGDRKGFKRGMHKGVNEGMHRLLLRLIAQRFGRVPDTIRRQIEKISDTETLAHIADGLLEVTDLKQLRKLVGSNGKFA